MAVRGSTTWRSCLFLVGAAVLAAIGLAAGSASGGGGIAPGAVLDQQNPWKASPCRYWGWAPDDASSWAAQTFTAAISGALTDVVLPLRGTAGQVTVAIAPVDASGMPLVGSPVASTSVAFAKPATYTNFDFLFPSPPRVAAGKQYAIVMSTPTETSGGYVAWEGDIGSTYADQSGARCGDGAYLRGRAWSKGTGPLGADADFFFYTYVSPVAATPPPAPKKPAAGTISAVNVRSVPAVPIAGAAFKVLASITLSTGRRVAPASARCAAKLAGLPLRGSGGGGCTFRIPRAAAGKRLAITVTVSYGAKTRVKAVVYTVRRPSPSPAPPPPAPPPVAQPGHFAGTTSGEELVSFDVTSDGRAITNITLGLHLLCVPTGVLTNPGLSILPTTRFTIAADGTFRPFTDTTFSFNGSVTFRLTVTFAGRFTGPGTATGTLDLHATVTSPGFYECGPFSYTWTATHA